MKIRNILTTFTFASIITTSAHAVGISKTPVYSSIDPANRSTTTDESDYFKGEPTEYVNDAGIGMGFNYMDSVGFQFRYARQLLRHPIRDLNNALYIEGSIAPTFYGSKDESNGVMGFAVVSTARWDFQMDRQWTFFGNAGLGYNAVTSGKQSAVRAGGIFPALGVGAILDFTKEIAARADVSYQFFGLSGVFRF